MINLTDYMIERCPQIIPARLILVVPLVYIKVHTCAVELILNGTMDAKRVKSPARRVFTFAIEVCLMCRHKRCVEGMDFLESKRHNRWGSAVSCICFW